MRSAAIILCLLLGSVAVQAEAFKGQVRSIGKASEALNASTTFEEGDLIQITEGLYSFSFGTSKVELGESSLVAIGQQKSFLEIYRGSANISVSQEPLVVIHSTSQLKILPGSQVYWATHGDDTHISLLKGKGHLLTPSEGKVLTSGTGVLIRNGEIESNILAFDLDGITPPMTPQKVEKIFEHTPLLNERLNQMGFLGEFTFEDPKEVIYYYLDILKKSKWLNHVQRGQDHLFAQKLLLLHENDAVFPESLKGHLQQTPTSISIFKDFARLDEGLAKMDDAERVFITFFVRQAMAEELIAKKELRNSITGLYRIEGRHQQNIAESPDDSLSVSEKKGASLTQQMQLKWVGLSHSWGKPSVSMRMANRSYFDTDFTDREVTTLTLSTQLNRTVGKKGDRILEVNPNYAVRFDFVNSNAGQDLNFITHSPQVEVVFAPIQQAATWSDLLFYFWKLGIDHRHYASGYRFSNGVKRDTSTLWTTWSGINAVSWKGMRVQESLSIDLRSSKSSDSNLEYSSFNMDLGVAFQQAKWELKPVFALRYRDQPEWRSEPRKDFKKELGLLASSSNAGNWADLSLGYRYISQDSTREELFSYIDHQWSMSLTKSF